MAWTAQDRYRLAEWGYSLYREGCHEQAIVVFEALLEASPRDAWTACALAANQLALGQILEALRTLEPFRSDPAARLLRAETLAIAGNIREAKAESDGIVAGYGPAWARLQLRLRGVHGIAAGSN